LDGPGKPQSAQRIDPQARIEAAMIFSAVGDRNGFAKIDTIVRFYQQTVVAHGFRGIAGIPANEDSAFRCYLNTGYTLPDTLT
jgi:hypothetical protein